MCGDRKRGRRGWQQEGGAESSSNDNSSNLSKILAFKYLTVTPPLPVRNTFYKASPYTDRVYRNSQKQCFPVSCATQRYFLFYTIKKKARQMAEWAVRHWQCQWRQRRPLWRPLWRWSSEVSRALAPWSRQTASQLQLAARRAAAVAQPSCGGVPFTPPTWRPPPPRTGPSREY